MHMIGTLHAKDFEVHRADITVVICAQTFGNHRAVDISTSRVSNRCVEFAWSCYLQS